VGERGEKFLKASDRGISINSIKEEGGARWWWARLGRGGCGEGEGEECMVFQREEGYREVLNIQEEIQVE
jgi:hypothetical protein